jgi:hypothetical protein
MSARFAIPATTFVLRGIVQQRLDLSYPNPLVAPVVSVEPPPRPSPTNGNPGGGNNNPQPEPARLHLFCHHVALNPAWRNMYDPHVSSAGQRVGPSPLAVDLHYLLAATGADLEREVLLGLGITALNRFGVVPRAKIAAILSTVSVPGTPARITDLIPDEQLQDPAEQPEQITITQQPVDLDLSTRVWSAFQSPLRPSAYFLVTTVFLDVDEVLPEMEDVEALQIGVRPDVSGGAPDASDVVTTP